jgi:hypothetical protein
VERAEEAVHGRLCEPKPLRKLADAEAALAAREGAQDAGGTVDGLNHRYSIAERCSTL